MKKVIINFGAAGGILSSILGTLNWLFLARDIGVEGSQTVGYLSIAFSLLCIPFGIRYYREKLNNGFLNFVQAFRIGLGITVMAGVVMAIHSILFFALQKEEFLDWQRNDLSGEDLVAYNEQLNALPDFIYTPWFQGIVMFIMVFLIGLIINLVSALLLQKRRIG